MDRIESFDPNRVYYVHIIYNNSEIVSKYMCYDDGEGVVKEEDGSIWIRKFRVTAAASAQATDIPGAYWERIAPVSKATYNVVNQGEEMGTE